MNGNPTWQNVSPDNLRKFRGALGAMRTGVRSPKILCIGDSTTYGQGSYGSAFINARVRSYPFYLAQALTRELGLTATFDRNCNCAAGPAGSTTPPYNTQVTLGAGWSEIGVAGLSGGFFRAANTVSPLKFSLPETSPAFDRIDIGFLRKANCPTFTVDVDGVVMETIDADSSPSDYQHPTISFSPPVSAGAREVNVKTTIASGVAFDVQSIRVYSSSAPEISILNGGRSGATVMSLSSVAEFYRPVLTMPIYAPDLTILMATINDSNALTNLVTYQTNLQNLITAAAITGSVILMSGYPSSGAPATLANYVAVTRNLAAQNNCPYLDLDARYVSYGVTNPVLPYFDALHPTGALYSDTGYALASLIEACA